MQDFWRSSKHTLYTTARLVWNHLFKVIGVFALAMTVFLSVCYYWVVFSPTDNYLRYDELSVADVEQGRRAVATVCYDVNERHSAEGEAVFYVENSDGKRVYDSQVDFDFTLSGTSPCEQEFIPTQGLEPGMYYLRLIRTIRVQTLVPFTEPVEKKADVAASDTFRVKERTYTKAEINAALDEINRQINELNKLNKQSRSTKKDDSSASAENIISIAPIQQSPVESDDTPAPIQPQPVIDPRPPIQTPSPANPQPTPTPAPQPERPGIVRGLVGGVTDTVNGLLKGLENVL